MRKGTLFISAALTTFVMAMLASAASAYQGFVNNNPLTASQSQQGMELVSQSNATPAPTIAPLSAPVTILSPEEAAGLAAQVIGRDDLFSVEVTDLNGETVYMVTFSSGDLVYVSLDGQIRSIGKVPTETVVVSSGGGGGGGNSGSGTTVRASQHTGEHEEHESHDD